MYVVVVPVCMYGGTVKEDVLHCPLCVAAKGAGGVCSTSYPVHVCGDGGVVTTAKAREMNSVFAWEVVFLSCVRGWGWGV